MYVYIYIYMYVCKCIYTSLSSSPSHATYQCINKSNEIHSVVRLTKENIGLKVPCAPK